MHIIFRCDASVTLGTGHVFRCLALAEELRLQGACVTFVCGTAAGNLNDWLSRGYSVLNASSVEDLSWLEAIQVRPDWLVVDHYGLDASWEELVKPCVGQIFVIDDLANRPHVANVVLDQNRLTAQEAFAYRHLLPKGCRELMGPKYALLRPEFARLHAGAGEARMSRPSECCRLLIFFGGTDPTGETERILPVLLDLASAQVPIDIVLGRGNPAADAVITACRPSLHINTHVQVDDMAQMMLNADLSLTAGGVTTWERLCLGLPGLVIATADNQLASSRSVASTGAHLFLGVSPALQERNPTLSCPSLDEIRAELLHWVAAVEARQHMSNIALVLVDGLGAQRIARYMMSIRREEGLPLI